MNDNNENLYEYEDRYGQAHTIKFYKTTYLDNGNLAVEADTEDDELGWVPYAVFTVNVGNIDDQNSAAINTNLLGDGVVDWLENAGIAQRTGAYMESGFCTYPVMRFDPEWLNSIETDC